MFVAKKIVYVLCVFKHFIQMFIDNIIKYEYMTLLSRYDVTMR